MSGDPAKSIEDSSYEQEDGQQRKDLAREKYVKKYEFEANEMHSLTKDQHYFLIDLLPPP